MDKNKLTASLGSTKWSYLQTFPLSSTFMLPNKTEEWTI